MKKALFTLLALSFITNPVLAAQKPAQKKEQHSSAGKRLAIFIRDTAIGSVLGLAFGFIWHLDSQARNNRLNAQHNPPPPYDGTEGAPNPPGGPAIAPVGNANNPYDRIITGLIVGAVGGALIGTAEVANDCVGTQEKQRTQDEADAALARQILKEEQNQQKRKV